MQPSFMLAHIHSNGQFCLLSSVQGSAPGAEFLSTLLPRMSQSCFQFLPLDDAPGYCAAICCRDNVSYRDDHRPGSMSFAFVFPPEAVRALLEPPETLFALMEYMCALTPQQVLSLVRGNAPPQWPSACKAGPTNSAVCDGMREVVIRRLGGEPCYAMAEGTPSDLLQLLRILPLSVRKQISFTIPYTRDACTAGLINLVDSPHRRFPNLPAIQRYTIGPGTSMPPLPDGMTYIEALLCSLNADPELDQAFCQMESFAAWAELAKLYLFMQDALTHERSHEARGIQRSSPEGVTLLLAHSPQAVQEHWQALLVPSHFDTDMGQKGCGSIEPHPTSVHFGKKLLVLLLLVTGLAFYLLLGAVVLRAANQIHLIITLSGGDIVKLLFGLVFGLGLGYVCFKKEDTR